MSDTHSQSHGPAVTGAETTLLREKSRSLGLSGPLERESSHDDRLSLAVAAADADAAAVAGKATSASGSSEAESESIATSSHDGKAAEAEEATVFGAGLGAVLRATRRPVTISGATDPRSLEVDIPSVDALLGDEALQARLMRAFNDTGVVVMNIADQHLESDQIKLKALFGEELVPHEKMQPDGRVKIDIGEPTSVNVANAAKAHMGHTDEAYSSRPARVLTLACEKNAVSGGESTLVSCQAMIDAVVAAGYDLAPLFEPDCLTVGRQLPGMPELVKCTLPILARCDTDAHAAVMRFRSLDSYILDIIPAARPMMELMHAFAVHPDNQCLVPLKPGQMALIDNTAVVHGRLPFDASKGRTMWRANFFNPPGTRCHEAAGHGIRLD